MASRDSTWSTCRPQAWAGRNVVTSVIGLKWKPSGHLEFGAGYELPLTANGDILDNRICADVIFRY